MSSYQLTKTKYLTDSEQAALRITLNKFYAANPRNCLLIDLALHTGGRAQEILNITAADLDPIAQTVFIRGLKGSLDREIPLPVTLFLALKAFSPEVGRIFPFTYNRFRQIWFEYRPVHKKLHCLRHTFAINLYRKSRDTRLVQVALGHKSLSNTLIYQAYQYNSEELRKAIVG